MTALDGVTAMELEHLVFMATCAPSVHNTQPWEFVPTGDGVLVRQDRTRQLSVLDPEGRELLVSCGTAVHHLQVAARALSLVCTVELLPTGSGPDAVARIGLARGRSATVAQVAEAVAILHRHTSRGRFSEDRLPAALLDRLRAAVEEQRGMFRVVHEDELTAVQVLVSRAEQHLHNTPGYADELARWVHPPGPEHYDDGLPAAAVDHGGDRAESLPGRDFGPGELLRPGQAPLTDRAPTDPALADRALADRALADRALADPGSPDPPPAEHPTVVLLSTLADSPLDWLQAGQSLSALLLAATNQGVVAQPIGQVVDIPAARWALQEHLGTVGAPQMLLRLGFGRSVDAPLSPRRPVGDVLHGPG